MDGLAIRDVSLDDAPAVARLLTQLGYPTTSEEMAARLEALQKQHSYLTFVAEFTDKAPEGR